MTISQCRAEIDMIDDELLRLMNRRVTLAMTVGESKRTAGLPLYDARRERHIIERVHDSNVGPLDNEAVTKLFRRIIHITRTAEARHVDTQHAEARRAGDVSSTRAIIRGDGMNDLPSASRHSFASPRVAFQGARGAYSEEAAVKLLGRDVNLVPRPTFETLFSSIDESVADLILAPTENSLAGSVQRTYDLLLASTLYIIAEVIIPIRHSLIGCPGASLDNVTIVQSHPVALAQCERFFAAHPRIKRAVTDDTAGSVAEVVRRNDPTHAAIAGRRAAEIYGGVILAENLEDHAENYTRFILLAPTRQSSKQADKTSLVIKIKDQPGALCRVLQTFAERNINLLKIESRPVYGSPWQYHFSLDLQASFDFPDTIAALNKLRDYAEDVRLLGCYKSATALALSKNLQTSTC